MRRNSPTQADNSQWFNENVLYEGIFMGVIELYEAQTGMFAGFTSSFMVCCCLNLSGVSLYDLTSIFKIYYQFLSCLCNSFAL